MKYLIAVIGGASCNSEIYGLAEEIGRQLAVRGVGVVCGGLTGVMEAVCKGATEAGGLTIGILPGNNPRDANPYVQIPIATGLGYARNSIVVKSGQAVIAINGAYGTLSEISHALGEGIPVVGLRTWTFAVDGTTNSAIDYVRDPTHAVERAMTLAEYRLTDN